MAHKQKPGFLKEDPKSADRRRNERLEYLSTRLYDIRHRHDEPEYMFFCYSDLRKIWQYDDILQIFHELQDDQCRTLRNELLRFVSFLVYIDVAPEWYSRFGRLVFPDSRLSNPVFSDKNMPLSEDELVRLGLPRKNVQRWHEQYCFIPLRIEFNPNEAIQNIKDTRIRLPFMRLSGETLHGGYGDVMFYHLAPEYVVDAHPQRKDWIPPAKEPLAVAVKQFHVPKDGLLEARNMRLLKESLTMNKNISLHEAILTQGTGEEPKVFIILPRAPYGDLWQFLHGGETINSRGQTERVYNFADRFPEAANPGFEIAPSLLKQCGNLAGALKFLHNGFRANNVDLFCAHMDLKPDNIIICKEEGNDGGVGMWKLCDFGISAFKEHPHSPDEYSPVSVGDYHARMTMRTRAKRDPGAYQAPEVLKSRDLLNLSPQDVAEQGRVGRKSDIWSFGAIFAEILAFALGRDDAVREFASYRTCGAPGRPRDDYFYATLTPERLGDPLQYQGDSFCVKPQVIQWLDSLCYRSVTLQEWAGCWLGCIKGILRVDPEERPKAHELERYVRHVEEHVRKAHQADEVDCSFKSANWYHVRRPTRQRTVPLPFGTPEPPLLDILVHPVPESSTDPFDGARQGEFLPSGLRKQSNDSSLVSGQFRSTQSPSPSAGSSPDADGIMYNPKVSRNVGSSEICKLEIPSEIIAVAADTKIIAYLTASAIHIFKIADYLDRLNTSQVGSIPPIPISSNEPDPQWKGIAVSGKYLVAWGVGRKSRESLLRVVHFTDGYNWTNMQIPEDARVRQFDYDKRVAVSARGSVAFIKSKELFVISYQDDVRLFILETPMTTSTGALKRATYEREFIDVAFDDEGTFLHAWANVHIDGALCIYRTSNLYRDWTLDSIGYYKYDTSEDSDTTLLIPLNTLHGCIVASSNYLYFPAIVRSSISGQEQLLERPTSKELQDARVKAVCMFNNCSLVTIQKSLRGLFQWRYQLFEYPVHFDNRLGLGPGILLCQTRLAVSKSSIIRVFEHNQVIYACIFHIDGKVEFIPFRPNHT
ncbi:hypothetical protein AAE478_001477 [Parahypoxylon ruwenzoriense]